MRALALAAAIAAAAAGPTAAAAQVAAASAPGSVFEDPLGKYAFVVPEGWEAVAPAAAPEPRPGVPRDLLLRDGWGTGAACRVSVADLPELARLDEAATRRLNEASHSRTDLADALRRSGAYSEIRALVHERLAVSGENAGYAQLAYLNADDGAFRPMMAHSTAFFHAGTVHAITCGSAPDAGNEAKRAFDAIAATYQAK